MFKIAILGGGVVGSGVADILIDKSKALSERFNKDISLKYVLDIRDMTGTKYEPYYTNDKDLRCRISHGAGCRMRCATGCRGMS